LTKDTEKIENKINDINLKIFDLEKSMQELNDKRNNLENYKIVYSKYSDLLKCRDEAKEKYEKSISYINRYNEQKEKLNTLNNSYSDYSKDLDDVKSKLFRIEDYNNRKENLDKDFKIVEILRETLSPTKGIPVFFIKNYLDKTKRITNDLLELGQHGKFAVDFDVNSVDFFIRIYKDNGDILDDIKQASQGEIALTSLSISLALIEQSLSKYNILLLDELDGALDTNNRRAFIDMITTQIKELNSEQVFIISHNNEFDSYPVDMVILSEDESKFNDKNFLKDKNIIFKR